MSSTKILFQVSEKSSPACLPRFDLLFDNLGSVSVYNQHDSMHVVIYKKFCFRAANNEQNWTEGEKFTGKLELFKLFMSLMFRVIMTSDMI